MQAVLDERGVVLDAPGCAGLAALHRHRRTELGKGCRLHPLRPDEIDDDAREQRREMEKMRVESIYTGIVGIEPGVVMDIDAGKGTAPTHFVHDLAHDFALGILCGFATRPDAVVVRLMIEAPQSGTRGLEVADEERQCARQFGRMEFFQHRLRCQPAGVLIAVQQYRHEQRSWPSSRQMNQCRSRENLVQTPGWQFKQTQRQRVVLGQHQISHSCTGAPARWFSR